MIIECKEMNAGLNEAVIRQILNYNISLKAEYLVLTNGKETFALRVMGAGYNWIDELPEFQ
jgi:hypothetical protein